MAPVPGFSKLGGSASVIDGKLDFVGLKPMNIAQLLVIFPKILLGDHIKHARVIYSQTKAFKNRKGLKGIC